MSAALQMIAGLAVVLAAIAGAAWLARRIGVTPSSATGLIRLVSSQSVGPKERVVVVEVSGQWLVLGVAPGRVSSLASVPRQELPAVAAEPFDFKKLFHKARTNAPR